MSGGPTSSSLNRPMATNLLYAKLPAAERSWMRASAFCRSSQQGLHAYGG